MKNENSLVDLFQGRFENNILTFNPGWDENANIIESFEDVREIQRQLKNKVSNQHRKQTKIQPVLQVSW